MKKRTKKVSRPLQPAELTHVTGGAVQLNPLNQSSENGMLDNA